MQQNTPTPKRSIRVKEEVDVKPCPSVNPKVVFTKLSSEGMLDLKEKFKAKPELEHCSNKLNASVINEETRSLFAGKRNKKKTSASFVKKDTTSLFAWKKRNKKGMAKKAPEKPVRRSKRAKKCFDCGPYITH
mmetsp:Transcript_36760/g.58925  ORF Transcript_36760/g.58925 Transcript_36760/m.58925 type:complete len:133 (+) Transcript_36760:104-502(+)